MSLEEHKESIVRIEDIDTTTDLTAYDNKEEAYDKWDKEIHPQIYYLLIKIKELEERITKLENPISQVEPK